jgi:hypothetical protein
MTNISPKLLDARYRRDYEARLEAMLVAWRTWRAAIIKAMASRLAQVGDTANDDELLLLQMEFEHCLIVRAGLAQQLGIDPTAGDDE